MINDRHRSRTPAIEGNLVMRDSNGGVFLCRLCLFSVGRLICDFLQCLFHQQAMERRFERRLVLEFEGDSMFCDDGLLNNSEDRRQRTEDRGQKTEDRDRD